MVIYRKEMVSDYDAIEEVIISDKYREWKDVENNEWKNLKRLRKSEIYDNRFSLVAEIDTKVIGHIIFVPIRIDNKKYLNFVQQSIHSDFQNMGIGRGLQKRVECLAEKLKYSGILALGHSEFFLNLGYKQVELKLQHLASKDERPLYIKLLGGNEYSKLFKKSALQLYDIKDFFKILQ